MSLGRLAGKLGKFTLLLALVTLLTLFVPQLLGMKCYSVVSGSMTPSLPVGSAVYISADSPEQIQEGEIITYCTDQGKTMITHRVVENNREKQVFITKGDANNSSDPRPVKWENLQGKAVFCIPFAGYVLQFLGSRNGKLAAALFLLAGYLATEIFEGKTKKECEKN